MGTSYKPLLESYRKFVKNFYVDIHTIDYFDTVGLTWEDCIFDRIFLEYQESIRKDDKLNELWYTMANDTGVRATNAWNKACEITKAKVKELMESQK